MSVTQIPDAEARNGPRDKSVSWYTDKMTGELGDSARKLLEEYSHIPSDQVESHVYAIVSHYPSLKPMIQLFFSDAPSGSKLTIFQRDKAWEIHPYPCIGQFRFLDLSITQSPHYPAIVRQLSEPDSSATFLDLGCCFGQDLRCLAAAGAPSTNLYASDLRGEFWNLGYELFKDRDSLKSTFIAGDVFDANSELKKLHGNIDIVYAASFLHLFDLLQQHAVCERIVQLLRAKPGSMVLGRQVGHLVATTVEHRTNTGGHMYRHNVESFAKMWREVGEKTGTRWRVEAAMMEGQNGARVPVWSDDGLRRFRFAVIRE